MSVEMFYDLTRMGPLEDGTPDPKTNSFCFGICFFLGVWEVWGPIFPGYVLIAALRGHECLRKRKTVNLEVSPEQRLREGKATEGNNAAFVKGRFSRISAMS